MKLKYILLLLLFCVSSLVLAQSTKDTCKVKTENKPTPMILGVLTQKPDTTKSIRNGSAYAGDVIKIKISHPQEFLESKPQDKSKLLLFIDGLPFSGISSTYFDQYSKQDIKNKTYALPDTITIPFVLLRNLDTKSTWDYLYRITDLSDRKITVEASVGWEGMFPLALAPKSDNRFVILFFHNYEVDILIGLYILFIGFFIYKGATTNMLRDYPPATPPGSIGPYSMAQTQLAFWTILIVGGFIYTLILTDITSSLNPSILLLLGISISTTGVASYVDYYKKNTASITVIPKQKSSFLKDILSDGSTYSVQRVQTAVWNLVLGLYFIYYTIDNKSIPLLNPVMAMYYIIPIRAEHLNIL